MTFSKDALKATLMTFVTKYLKFLSNKCYSFELSIYQSIQKKYITVSTKILRIIKNNKFLEYKNQHIRMITERSGRSIGFAITGVNFKYIKIENSYFIL